MAWFAPSVRPTSSSRTQLEPGPQPSADILQHSAVATAVAVETPGNGYIAVEYVFLQFAGFTFGKSSSAYSTPWNGYPGNNSSYLIGGNDTVTGVNNIQYTAQFGNGVSASVGLDDPSTFNRTSMYNSRRSASAQPVSAPTPTAARNRRI